MPRQFNEQIFILVSIVGMMIALFFFKVPPENKGWFDAILGALLISFKGVNK